MARVERFGIQRDDEQWYCGTADHKARFRPELTRSGVFKTSEEARRRSIGLAHAEQGRKFTIVPII